MSDILVPMLSGDYAEFDAKKFGTKGSPIHDACTTAYLLRPEIFSFKFVGIRVETESPLTRGHMSVDYWAGTDWPANCRWAINAEPDMFFDLFYERIEAYGKA